MGFRTLDIGNAAEIHIKNSQLEITQEDGTVQIPVEDLTQIIAHGANIRLSTMDLSILSQNKVSLITLDNKYLPTAIVLPFEGNTRQSKVMHAQVNASSEIYNKLWFQIIRKKIQNQAQALSILQRNGGEKILQYVNRLSLTNMDTIEALAAKEYFELFHTGLNRRIEDPINSRLNYGYAIVRSAIARSLVAVGFHPTFGIHHNSQLNAFNLADDLIEPYRAIVDVTVFQNQGESILLSRKERHDIAHVLHNACIVDRMKINIQSAIDAMCESLKRIILNDSNEELLLPNILPIESLEGITE